MTAIDYTDLASVIAELPGVTSDPNGLIAKAITRASRWIDRITGTTFYPVTETRTFYTRSLTGVYVDRFTSTVGLVVQTGFRGSYSTTLTAGQFVLWPPNAPSRGKAYRRIDVPDGLIQYDGTRFPPVQVTAAWGYDTVPPEVEAATRILAQQIYRRQFAPDGSYSATGETDYSTSRDMDPYVRGLLRDFMDVGIA